MRTLSIQSLLPGAGSSFLSSTLALCAARECRVLLCDLTKSHSTTLSAFNLPLALKVQELEPRQALELSSALTYYPQAYYSALERVFAPDASQADFTAGLEGLIDFFSHKDFDLLILDAGCKDSTPSRSAGQLTDMSLTVLRPDSASVCALSEIIHRDHEFYLFNPVLIDSNLQSDLMLFAYTQISKERFVPIYIPYDDDVLSASLNNHCVLESAPYSAAAKAVESLNIFCLLQTDRGLEA